MNPGTNNIHAVIYHEHGQEVMLGVRKWGKTATKLGALQNHHHCNIRYIHSNVNHTRI